MSWTTETVVILRTMILDLDDSPRFQDSRLEQILLVAAFQVNVEADFTNDYSINIETSTLSPDPTDSGNRDDSFINLMTLKAACILDRGLASLAAGTAIYSKEFNSSLDLRGIAQARLNVLQKGGWCKVYEDALIDHSVNSNQVAGAAILGPFRTLAGYGSTPYDYSGRSYYR